ncbi:zeta toxin family protein [Mesorhizobium sp. M0664]|uniref:zeta toxin family protein n=1 Tax=Mesorhizobium sp. M0664 TaxID=2956982 RepID=UPI00333D3772
MDKLGPAVRRVVALQIESSKPLAIVLAGHNGSGKSTMWQQQLAPVLKIPLINADRMMMSILPEPRRSGALPHWAQQLRDDDQSWMRVAQKGVEAFVAQALANKVPFAMETVFSYWQPQDDGTVVSKIDQIRQMQAEGYYVIIFFVGLTSAELSIARVETRVSRGGHAVDPQKLLDRFPRTQKAINKALEVADAAILVDNSRDREVAFTVCHVRAGNEALFDWRDNGDAPPPASVLAWLDLVAPREDQPPAE